MAHFHHPTSDQIRQMIDTEQVYDEWTRTSAEIDHRFRGAMGWKIVSGRKYLYRKSGTTWKSLGAQSEETERIHRHFHDGRESAKDRLAALSDRLNAMAAINRAMRIGRVPVLAARVLRALDRAGLTGTALDVVGTYALYVYERMAGVTIESALLATGVIDLLFDARTNLKLIGGKDGRSSLLKILQSVDKSFHLTAKSSFRVANRDGFLIDLITSMEKSPLPQRKIPAIGDSDDDLVAVETEGLNWLVNSPKVSVVLIDERGYPFRCSCPDPRAFALHKFWLGQRYDPDPLKRTRDRQQAQLIVRIIQDHLPHLLFDDPALGAIPKHLRSQVDAIAGKKVRPSTEPGW